MILRNGFITLNTLRERFKMNQPDNAELPIECTNV